MEEITEAEIPAAAAAAAALSAAAAAPDDEAEGAELASCNNGSACRFDASCSDTRDAAPEEASPSSDAPESAVSVAGENSIELLLPTPLV